MHPRSIADDPSVAIEQETSISDDIGDAPAEPRVTVNENWQSFWHDRDWPEDVLKNYIFLGAAVEQLGSARFDQSWVGLLHPNLPEAHGQRGKIFRELTERLASGDLTTYTQPVEGGAFEAISADIWNLKKYRSRFKYCRIHRKKPFKNIGQPNGDSYIFLSRVELDSLIQAGSQTQLTVSDLEKLPIFLQALIRTATALNITSETPPLSTDVIEARFRQVARQSGIEAGVSNRLVKYACTILRPPGAGRSKKSAQKK